MAGSAEVRDAAQALARGDLIGLPTETVYGLAADAMNPLAVAAIFTAKGRPVSHPLIVHVVDAAQVPKFASHVPVFAQKLMSAFWPGPLTVILPRLQGVADTAAGAHPTIALRCPSHPMALALLHEAQGLGVQGVAAPSANLFGRVSPTTAAHVRQAFPSLLVLDGGACEVGIESTIVDCSRTAPVVLRPGMLLLASLSAACGELVAMPSNAPDSTHDDSPAAPGSLASHYAPHACLRLMSAEAIRQQLPNAKVKVAVWARFAMPISAAFKQVQMPANPAECAHDLFARLRELDASGAQEIWVEAPPAGQDWDGVRDRLQRASN
ncbi:MAG: threonylcarbamoyl-AMP synthase [Burkholderiales bacterium]|nr:threonylcarbamoyl-AMP synthase [Burkholderiales bacterium]